MTLLVIVLILSPFLITAAYAGLSAAPWLPTKQSWQALLIDSIQLKNGDVVYDLGCGDGRVLFRLANTFPNAHYIGIEISLLPYLIGRLRQLLTRAENVEIRFGNAFKADLKDADVIFLFLLAAPYEKFARKFKGKITDHCRIFVQAWKIPGIEPLKTHKRNNVVPLFEYEGWQLR